MRDPKVERLFEDVNAALDVLDGRCHGISSIAKCQAARDAIAAIKEILYTESRVAGERWKMLDAEKQDHEITKRERNLHRREVEHLQLELNRRS